MIALAFVVPGLALFAVRWSRYAAHRDALKSAGWLL